MKEIQELGIYHAFSTEIELPIEFLHSDELDFISSYGEKAKKDFILGRYCAKNALKKMGFNIAEISLLKLDDGQTTWPEGVIGSISHAPGLSGALVGWKKNFQSIGLDIEQKNRVKTETWNRIFSEEEQSFLLKNNGAHATELATEIFSLKEAFYKFQWPLTRTFLGMRDVAWNEGNFHVLKNIQLPHYSCFSIPTSQHVISICIG